MDFFNVMFNIDEKGNRLDKKAGRFVTIEGRAVFIGGPGQGGGGSGSSGGSGSGSVAGEDKKPQSDPVIGTLDESEIDKRHNIWLPKSGKIKIHQAQAALEQLGYGWAFGPRKKPNDPTLYNITKPNGEVVTVTAKDLSNFVYATQTK